MSWGRALDFCVGHSSLLPGGTALEVGADGDDGGLSLFLAARGWEVTCSGLQPPSARKLELHHRHGVASSIRYSCLDVLNPPAEPKYDLIAFKAVLGQIGRHERFDLQRRAVRNLHALLEPGGELWVLEVATATPLHRLLRERRLPHCDRYLRPDELDVLLAPFTRHERASFGVAPPGRRSGDQHAAVDLLNRALLEPLTPPRWRAVLAAVATKQDAP